MLLEGVQTERAACLIGEKLRLAVAEPISWQDKTITATLSIGVYLHNAGETTDAFLDHADQATYAAKSGGRNRVVAIT